MKKEQFEVNGIIYEIDGENAIVVAKPTEAGFCSAYEGVINIPPVVEHNGKQYNVTRIGEYAFLLSGCIELTIPNSVIEVKEDALTGLELEELTVPKRFFHLAMRAVEEHDCVANITDYDVEVDGIFYKLSAGEAQVVAKGEFIDGEINGIIPSYTGSVTIPSTIMHDGIEYKVTAIAPFAFCNSEGLTDVVLPWELGEIGNYAFLGCTGLKSVNIHNCRIIGTSAFSECFSLESVTCYYSSSLNKDTYPPKIDGNTFSNYGVLHVLPQTKKLYESEEYWNKFNIVEDASSEEMIKHMLKQVGILSC